MDDLKRNKLVADIIKPLLMFMDSCLESFKVAGITIKELDEIREKMQGHNSSLAAWPFPETMQKADAMQVQTDTFRQIIKLLEIRKHQWEVQLQLKEETPGEEVLKHLGF